MYYSCNRKNLIVVIAAFVLLSDIITTRVKAQIPADIMDSAYIALDKYIQLVEETGVPQELASGLNRHSIILGEPYWVFILNHYNLDNNANLLNSVQDPKTFWFPVFNEGKIWAELEIYLKDGIWIPGKFSSGYHAKHLDGVMQEMSRSNIKSLLRNTHTLVKIPELGLLLVRIQKDGLELWSPLSEIYQDQGLFVGNVYGDDEIKMHLRAIFSRKTSLKSRNK